MAPRRELRPTEAPFQNPDRTKGLPDLCQNLRHFGLVECVQRLGAHVAQLACAEADGRDGLDVRGFDNRHDVVASQCPVQLFDVSARLLDHGRESIGAFGRVFDATNTLIGEMSQHDIGTHFHLSLWLTSEAAGAARLAQPRRRTGMHWFGLQKRGRSEIPADGMLGSSYARTAASARSVEGCCQKLRPFRVTSKGASGA